MKLQSIPFSFNLSVLLLLSTPFSGYAAEPLPPDAGLLMRESRTPPPPPPKQQSESAIEKPVQSRPPMSAQSNLRISVKNFLLSGNTLFTQAELEALLNSYTGHEIGFNDLQAAADAITQYYRDSGYFLALAYLPQQSIKQGQVEIAILEGQLDNTHLTSDTIHTLSDIRLNKSVLQRYLDTQEEGQLITEKDMNHLSLLINSLPGMDGKIVLAPGAKTGSSSLSLKVKEAPLLSGYLKTDNNGMYSTGYYHMEGSVSINDATGWGDQLNLRLQSTETGNSISGWADYSLPINGYGTTFAANFSELHYNLGRSFKTSNAYGLARTAGASLSHPLWLAREGRLTGTAHYEHRWMEDDQLGGASHNNRELNVMSFSFAGNLYDQLLLSSGLTQGYVSVTAGEVAFTNRADYLNDQRLGSIYSNGGYHKVAWQLSRTQNIIDDLSLFANFQGQVGSKNLDSSEQMSLGGPNAIRAYPAGEGSGDEGWLFNGEVRYHLPSIPHTPGYTQLVGFIDTGFSRINANPVFGQGSNSRHLTGYGFGLNWLDMMGFTLRTSIAWRDTQKLPVSDKNAHQPQVYFQLIKTF